MRADSGALQLIKDVKGLLEVQGVRLQLPGIDEYLDSDIVVAPLEGSPEEKAYKESLKRYRGPLIQQKDPIRALALALTYPETRFSRLVFGVDPGRECGFSAIGDRLVIYIGKIECGKIGNIIGSLIRRLPSSRYEVYVGNGCGFATAVDSLLSSSIYYEITDESGTSKAVTMSHISKIIKDRDIIASIAIALRGAYSVRRIDKYLYK